MADLDQERLRINEQLKAKLLARMPSAGYYQTAIPEFGLARRELANELCDFYKPFIGLTVQGFKRSLVGKNEYFYGEYHCVVCSVDMPSQSYIVTASADTPFLGMLIDLDRGLVAKLASEMPPQASGSQKTRNSLAVMEADPKVMTAFLRLLELLDEPDMISVMAPMLIREIHYRILCGPQGEWLRSICSLGTTSNQVARAVSWLRENFKNPLKVEELAQWVGMSVSSFFRNFKQLTSLTPLQFQKSLRLYEAQRLMLAQEYDVTTAAYAVGYESSTQFIREYKRMFGDPPHRDVIRKKLSLH